MEVQNAHQGRLARWRDDWFGVRSDVDRTLEKLERRGTHAASIAHFFATLIIILFSAGSLVALGGEALTTFLTSWRQGVLDIPAAVSLLVSALIVPALDVAMLYAASQLRILRAGRAPLSEQWLHIVVLGVVTLVESSTFIYMSAVYERPHDPMAWALIIVRAVSAPFLATYLNGARAIPTQKRDVLHQAALQSGRQVLVRVATIAADPSISLASLMDMYNASGDSNAVDTARLDRVAEVARKQIGDGGNGIVVDADPTPPNGGPGTSIVPFRPNAGAKNLGLLWTREHAPTGSTVRVMQDRVSGVWVVQCATHKRVLGARGQDAAERLGNHPDAWCEGCSSVVEYPRAVAR